MSEQKGRGALLGVKSAAYILLLYSLHWLLAAGGIARSVVALLSTTNVQPTSLFVDPAQTLGSISPYRRSTNYALWVLMPITVKSQAVDTTLKFLRFPDGKHGDRVDLDQYQIDDVIKLAHDLSAALSI